MLDLNYLLFFVAIVTPVAILAKAWRPEPHLRAWRFAAIAVLIVAGASWLLVRHQAGYVAGGAWLALLFIPAMGLRRVAELAEGQRFRSARRLARILHVLHPSRELGHEIELLRMYESRPDLSTYAIHTNESRRRQQRGLRAAPAVTILIALNIAAFLFEISHKHWRDWSGLHRLGALEPPAVLYQHEYWRLLTALFLHANVLHITVNLFALYVLGPALERGVGPLRFFACYLVSGLGSSIGVVWLSQLHIARADQLVGASGCVMGIVGAWAAYLLRHRHMPLARQRLLNVAMIVVIQTIFDRLTPEVSMSAHLCGLATGFIVGLALGPGRVRREE